MELIDAHGHLNDEKYDDVESAVERAEERGVIAHVCASCDLASSQKSVELANRFSIVYAAVGFHPENISSFDKNSLSEIEKLAKNYKVVAIGEIGLDYYYEKETKEEQKEIFANQIDLANKLNLPVVIHSREAMGDTLEILKKHSPKKESLMHCYGGSIESARELMKLGFSFSFGGLLTFKNATNVIEVVKQIPIERILLETDCPYMTPAPYRGQRNEPSYIVYTADMLAKIKGLTLEDVAKVTTQNARRLFGI